MCSSVFKQTLRFGVVVWCGHKFCKVSLNKCTISICFCLLCCFVAIMYSTNYILDLHCSCATPTTSILKVRYWIFMIHWFCTIFFELTLENYVNFQFLVLFFSTCILGKKLVHLFGLFVGCASNKNIEHMKKKSLKWPFLWASFYPLCLISTSNLAIYKMKKILLNHGWNSIP
jgi:hypothetical protein